jgi:hypothetical protein
MMPVLIVASQPRGLQREYRAHLAAAHRREQRLEARAFNEAAACPSLVLVDHDNLRELEVFGMPCEIVLTLAALMIVTHLMTGRLPHINVRGAVTMMGLNFLVHFYLGLLAAVENCHPTSGQSPNCPTGFG